MSNTPLTIRPNEEALAALLIFAALGIGSLFSVVKTVGNRFVGSGLGDHVCRNQRDQGSGGSEELRNISVDRDGTEDFQNDHSKMDSENTMNNNERSQKIQIEPQRPQLPSPHRERDREEGVIAIHALHEARTSRTQRGDPQKITPIPSSFDPHDSNPQTPSHDAELAWQKATILQIQQEISIRRLRYLWRDNGRTESDEVVSGWEEPATLRDVSRMMGVRAVEAWEVDVRRGISRQERVGAQERRMFAVGDDGRVVLFLW